MRASLSGGCLCGAVRFTAVPAAPEMSACHCGMCRRWTGSMFLGVDCGTSVRFEDEDTPALGVFASSDFGERVFCPTCGSTLFWRLRDGSKTEVAAQAFDDPSGLPLTQECFIEEKPSTYAFAGATRKLTSADVMARMEEGRANG